MQVHRIRVKPGAAGQAEFQSKIRALFSISDDVEFDVTFRCKVRYKDSLSPDITTPELQILGLSLSPDIRTPYLQVHGAAVCLCRAVLCSAAPLHLPPSLVTSDYKVP
jgi:hypothetical protein